MTSSRVCTTPGCPNLRPCPTHQVQPWAGSDRRQTLPPDWRRTRARILRRDHHQCTIRIPDICTGTATEVDHIGDRHNHHDNNLRSACHTCHLTHTLEQATTGRRTHRPPN